MIIVGTRIVEKLAPMSHGWGGTAASMASPYWRAASSEPPPPIECPDTPSRFLSRRFTTGLDFTSQYSAAASSPPRWAGRSNSVNVLMAITTKPWLAYRRAMPFMADPGVKNPGDTPMAPKVPWLVSDG